MKNNEIYASVADYDNPVPLDCDGVAELAREICKVSGIPEQDIQDMQLKFTSRGVLVSASYKAKRFLSNRS